MAAMRRVSGLALVAVLAVGCTEPLPVGIPAGTYEATTYLSGPSPAQRLDMLALGITWTLTVGDDRSVIDHWHVVGGDGTMVSDVTRTGIVHLEGNTATFAVPGDDHFLSGRTWTVDGNVLSSVDQTVDGMNAIIRFTRK
jgi:hypothetical protein